VRLRRPGPAPGRELTAQTTMPRVTARGIALVTSPAPTPISRPRVRHSRPPHMRRELPLARLVARPAAGRQTSPTRRVEPWRALRGWDRATASAQRSASRQARPRAGHETSPGDAPRRSWRSRCLPWPRPARGLRVESLAGSPELVGVVPEPRDEPHELAASVAAPVVPIRKLLRTQGRRSTDQGAHKPEYGLTHAGHRNAGRPWVGVDSIR
jgi:hypothetical protein